MKIYLTTFLYILMSATYASDKDCTKIIDAFFSKSTNVSNSSKQSAFIKQQISKLKLNELTDEAVLTLQSIFKSKNDIKDQELLEQFLHFVNSQQEKNQNKIAKNGIYLFEKDMPHKSLKKFKKHVESIKKYSKKKLSKLIDEVKLENPKASDKKVNSIALKKHKSSMKEYSKIYYGCKAPKWTPERKNAGNTFKKFTLGIGTASSIGAYTYQNWDKEKNAQWYGKISYEVVWGLVTGFLGSKIISNPSNSNIAKAAKKYLLSRGTGLVDMGIYGYLFSADYEKAKKQAREILADPTKKEEVKKLKAFLEEENLYHQFQQALDKNYSNLSKSKIFEQSENISNKLTASEIEEPIKYTENDVEALTAAVMAQVYTETKGPLIETGYIGADRYVFHAGYGLLMLPKDIFVSLGIYNILCLGQQNPRKALIQALALYTINRVIFDQVYYYARRKAINI